MSLEDGMEKHGLSFLPRATWGNTGGTLYETESEHALRHRYSVRVYSHVLDYLERTGQTLKSNGGEVYLYEALRRELDHQGIDWDEFWQEFDENYDPARTYKELREKLIEKHSI